MRIICAFQNTFILVVIVIAYLFTDNRDKVL